MNEASTEHLIDQLASRLAPVSLVPRLRVAVGAVALPGLALAGLAVFENGGVGVVLAPGTPPALWLGTLVGLLAIGVVGCLGGLASSTPGRNATANVAAVTVGLGLVVCAGVGFSLWFAADLAPLDLLRQAAPVHCVLKGAAFAVVPALIGVGFVRRAWVLAPRLTVPLVLLGTTALGALAVHLTCPVTEPTHLFAGHGATPLAATVIVAPIVIFWLRRRLG